jgi:D-alanine-D-alanine ligase
MTASRNEHGRLRVAVLMGGSSSERPISLSTGDMIRSALDPSLYAATTVDTRDVLSLMGPGAAPAIEGPSPVGVDGASSGAAMAAARPAHVAPVDGRPDVVFIALHGKGGEDGSVQGMLELMGVPYTGSGILASALAMDKRMAKRLFRGAGVPVIEDIEVIRGSVPDEQSLMSEASRRLGFPVFVKPNAEGSTFGCSLVERPEELSAAVERALAFDSPVLIERYVRGVEITVGVLENGGGSLQALPVIEIVPRAAFYDYESKYAEGGSEHIIPARLPDAQTQRAQELALECHALLGCRGMSRTDMIVDDRGIVILEVNTIPGMTPTSLLPQAAAAAGIPFPELLHRIIVCALGGAS